MRITEQLNVEHGLFLGLLEQIEERLVEGAVSEARVLAKALLRLFESHCGLEDRVLYPALARIAGSDLAPLRAMEADHREIARLADIIRFGDADAALLETFVPFLREHMEREIHLLSPLIEEWVPGDLLTSLCDWNGDHVREQATRKAAPPRTAPTR